MLFTSLQFAIFFIVVYLLYLMLNHKWQNRMLLVASYVFYAAWDWRFLSLILISTTLDYFCGIKIDEAKDVKRKKLFLLFSLIGNLSILGIFKYFNFFSYNLQTLLNFIGFPMEPRLFNIILPVGISFYTFKTMTYTIGIYWGQMKPTNKFLDYALFVAFFPTLLSGPIDRAKSLLPQIQSQRKLTMDKFCEGSYLIFWGLFQKVFIADNLATVVNPVFSAGPPYEGVKVLLAIYAYAFQLFCDFDGYSNIAKGLGSLMGFDIMVNFRLPYFATNPKEFWRRWHISLSSWLRDYLYIPLGGNRKGGIITYRNLGITMLLIGLWHGAAWTFIVWGAYHGMLLVAYRAFLPLIEKNSSPKRIRIDKIWFFIRVMFFFHLVCIGWLIFRAQSMTQVFSMLYSLFFNFSALPDSAGLIFYLLFFVFPLLIVQLFQHIKKDDLMIVMKWPAYGKAIFILAITYLYLYAIILGGKTLIGGGGEFIYFQF